VRPRIRPVGAGLVAAAMLEREGLVDLGDAVELGRPVPQPFGHEMDHQPFALHPARHGEQARAHHDAAMRLEHLGPDHEIGDAAFVLDGDEHTPEAVPGRWRTRTRPASVKRSSFLESSRASVRVTRLSDIKGRKSDMGWERNDIENEA